MALEPVWKSIIANCTPKLWRTSYRKLFSKHALGDKLVIPDIIKWYECQKVFWHSFDTRIATQLRCSRNPPNIRNPLIYCVNRYFLIFGVSQVQKPYRASTNSFLTFWHWYHNIKLWQMIVWKLSFARAFLYMCPDNGLTAKTTIKPHETLNLRKKFHTVATLKNSILSFMHS